MVIERKLVKSVIPNGAKRSRGICISW